MTTMWLRVMPAAAVLAFSVQAGRDRPAVPAGPPAATGRVAGIVVDASANDAPLRRAMVTLAGAELPRGVSTISDEHGRFDFDHLPEGRFTITASKPAYLDGASGASRPGRPGVPLQLAAGQNVNSLRIALTRGAVLSGALRDEAGDPLPNQRVAAYRVPVPGAPPNLAVAGLAVTDDRGVYRIYGLMPGTYVVSSTRPIGARMTDVRALSTSAVDQALRELAQRAGTPQSPAAPPGTADLTPPGQYAAAPVFYPGVADPALAQTVPVTAGEERANLDFAVPLVRMLRIDGHVPLPAATPPTMQFVIRTTGVRLTSLLANVPVLSTQAGPSGRAFTYSNVSPGRYVITVRTRSGDALFARADVDVTTSDLIGMTLALQPTPAIRGRVVYDGTRPLPAAGTVQVQLTPANEAGYGGAGTTQLGNFSVPPAPVGADGHFVMPGVIPETYRLTTSLPVSSGWYLRSAVLNGRDVLDSLLDVPADADVDGLVLTYSDRPTQLSGTLRTASGQPAPEYFIAVFPAHRDSWRYNSRRIRSARAGTDGRWILTGLPPGDYVVAALTDLDADELWDPAFLEALMGSGVRLSLADGDSKTQDLRLSGK